MLSRQHFVHNTQLLLLSTVAYVGAIFVVLSVAQVGDGLGPHDTENFQGFLIAFVAVFGIIYAGHAFPAFRSKESTISYLMVPASALEKFVFEFMNRVVVIIVLLPLIYWAIFHVQGYFFAMFTDEIFHPVGLKYLVEIDVAGKYRVLIYTMIASAVFLAIALAFTGAAMFGKQPLVKSLFALAVIVMFYFGYSFIVLEYLGLEKYSPPETMYLLPLEHAQALQLQLASIALMATIAVMLFVAFRKLKEREV